MTFALGTTAGAGTISIVAGGTAVTGVNTAFVSANIGSILVVGSQWGVISTVVSATSITIDRPFTTAVTASTYAVSGNYPIITQSGTDTTLSAFNTLAGVSNLSLGDARVYQTASAMLNVTGTLTIPALTEKLVFDNQTDTAVGGTQRDHDIQVSGTLNINLSSVSNGTTIYAPDFVYFSRRPAPSGGGGEHQLNATGSSFYITPTGTANLTGGTYVTQFNFACDTGGRLNVTGAHLKGRGNRFWMKTGSITTFQNCMIENFSIFFNAFPTSISGVTFKQCGTITKEITFNGGFDSAPNVVLAPQWLATANPIINIWGGAWLRVKNASGGSSLGVLNTAATPWASGIADFHQDVSFTTKDLAGAAVVGFKFYAAESNDGNRRNVQQYTGTGPFFNNTDIRTMLFTTATGGVSNSIEMRLQAGVTTLTPTATPGSGGLVTTNYGQTTADEYDFFGIGYNYALSQNRIQCRASGALSIATVALPDLSITQSTMATVAAYTALDTAQQFYDYAKYFLCDNFAGQTATYVTRAGDTINAGSYNVTIDATAAAIFALAGSTLTAKSSTFTGSLTTSGAVTLVNGAVFANNTVTANVSQATPTNLTGVTINGNLTYNTNTPITITLTNCTISGTVSNSGTGAVTISRQNSTIGTAGANVTTRPVTSLTLSGLTAGSQVYVANGSGTQVAYVASSTTSYTLTTTGQTGAWTWKVARYGFTAQTGTHAPAVASTTAAVALPPDLFITQAVKATVGAYNSLENLDRLYDYAAYFETTPEGIAYARVITKAGTSASAGSYPVEINYTGDLWIFDGSALSIWTNYQLAPGATITGALFTTGVVTLPDTFSNASIIAPVSQPDPGNMNDVSITGSFNYNTSAPYAFEVTLTNCTITGAINNLGTSDVIITKVNTSLGTLGARVTARQYAAVSAPGLLAGTTVRLVNKTTGAVLDESVTTGAGYTYSALFTGSVQIELQFAKLGYLMGRANNVLTSGGATFLNTQSVNSVYNANGWDGAALLGAEFATDFVNVQLDISDADNITSFQRLYAWFSYIETTFEGLQKFAGAITAIDTVNYVINVPIANIKLDNRLSTPVVIVGGSMTASDGTSIIAATSGSIQIDPAKAYLANTSSIAAALAARPTLAQIEASDVLAKEATAQAILGLSV